MANLRALRGQIETVRTQLTQLINESKASPADINNITTRARSGFRVPSFGPGSSQYEQAGGTRPSERKRPARKTPA